jgi:CheY-like chemotaxis protein/plasmid maintenance system antidote protein VapI
MQIDRKAKDSFVKIEDNKEVRAVEYSANDHCLTIDEYVGQKLRDFRERVGLTLLECAEKVGVSHQQIHKYELGQTKISTSMLYKFCKVFSITPNCFFEGYPLYEKESLHSEDEDITCYPNLDKINVVLVEDNAEDQFLIRKVFEEHDLKINLYCIHDGEEFLNIIKTKGNISKIPLPDLIFLDINMPKIDGLALLRSIKQNKEMKHIPVIVLTGSISIKDVMNSYTHFASGYIRKSFEYETLKKNIHLAINYWTEAVILPYNAWN